MPGRTKKVEDVADDTVMDDAPTSAQPEDTDGIEAEAVDEQDGEADEEDEEDEEEPAEPQRVRIV